MTRDQKTVAIGALAGILMMVLLVSLLSRAISPPNIADTPGHRLGYALRWGVVAVLPLFFMIATVGNARFLSDAIDPTLRKEEQKLVVNGRVADNTTQQFLLFMIGISALSVTLPIERMSYVPAVAITFVICRLIFWIGYRMHPLYRAPGFSSTAYLNLSMFIAVLWMWLT